MRQVRGGASERRPVILFQTIGPRYRAIREWLPVAALLAERGIEPVFLVNEHATPEWQERCAAVGVRCRTFVGSPFTAREAAPGAASTEAHAAGTSERSESRSGSVDRAKALALAGAKRALRGTPVGNAIASVRRVLVAYRLIRRIVALAQRVLSEESPLAVVVHNDADAGLSTAVVRRAIRRRVPAVTLPLASGPPKTGLVARKRLPTYASELSLERPTNRLAAALFPRLAFEAYGTRLLYFPVTFSAAAWLAGTLPRLPYALGAESTHVFAPSRRVAEIWRDEGVPEDTLVVVGRPEFDQLARALRHGARTRAEISASMRIAKDTIVVFGLAQWAEHALMSWDDHWREQEALLATLTQCEGIHVVISLPPASNTRDYEELARRYGCSIATAHGITDLLPAADIYVAGTSSTTILHAIGCHVPTLVLEFYGMEYSAFEYGGGVIVVRDRKQLLPLLRSLVEDLDLRARLGRAQAEVERDWILMDGQCTRRIADALESLATHGAEVRPC